MYTLVRGNIDHKVVHEQLLHQSIDRIHNDVVPQIGRTYCSIKYYFRHSNVLYVREISGTRVKDFNMIHPCSRVFGTKITKKALLAYATTVANAAPAIPYSGIHQAFS